MPRNIYYGVFNSFGILQTNKKGMSYVYYDKQQALTILKNLRANIKKSTEEYAVKRFKLDLIETTE